MRRTMLKCKVHRATVTDSDHELVHLLDIANGNRFETYTIAGTRGSGNVVINGAAARLAHEGDKVIVASYAEYDEAELAGYDPKVAHMDGRNRTVDVDANVERLVA